MLPRHFPYMLLVSRILKLIQIFIIHYLQLQFTEPTTIIIKLNRMNTSGINRMKVLHFLNYNQLQLKHPGVAEEEYNNTVASLSPMSTDESINTHNNHCTLLQESPSSLFAGANNVVRLSQLETDNQLIQYELANLTLRLDTLETKFVQANEKIWSTLQQILQHLNSADNKVEKTFNNSDYINDKEDV
jgi:hypothetical protein